MKLAMDFREFDHLSSQTQRVRLTTERWASQNVYCFACGCPLQAVAANMPVLDLSCPDCHRGFELKSSSKPVGRRIPDGAHSAMARRLADVNSPSFLILTYDGALGTVRQLFGIPSYCIDISAIEKRSPLSDKARRAGWVGCNIRLDQIPAAARVDYVRDGLVLPKQTVLASWQATAFLAHQRQAGARSWLLEVIRCIETLSAREFVLDDLYRFESHLSSRYPENRHVRAKIRQQLQVLRDSGWLEFRGGGRYFRTATAA